MYDSSKIKSSNQAKVLNSHITATTTDNVYSDFFTDNFSMIKADTLYTFVVDVYKNTLDPSDCIWINSYLTGDASVIQNSDMKIYGGNTGRFIFKSKSISDFSNARRLLRSFIDNSSKTVGAEVDLTIMMFEGDLSANPPDKHFEGIKSSFENQLVTQDIINSGLEN